MHESRALKEANKAFHVYEESDVSILIKEVAVLVVVILIISALSISY